MTTDQLRKVINAQPFQPFTIHLADGRELNVPHPDFISHSPLGRTCVVWETEVDACEIIDLLLVTGLELRSDGKTKAKNGGSKKRKNGKRKR